MSNSAAVGDLTIPQIWRQGCVVKVDTFGGAGTLREISGEQEIKNLTGTVTLSYKTEEDAIRAEGILSRWRDDDDLVHCEAASNGRVSLTNQRTGQRVVVEPLS